MFSRSCEYAFQAILYIAVNSDNGKPVGLKPISESQKIPLHFLSKILQRLVKYKVLESIKGPNGGFVLRIPPNQLTMLEIVEIIDGSDIFDRCGIGLKDCSDESPCPIHHKYKSVRKNIRELFEESTIEKLSLDVANGNSNLVFFERNTAR